MLGHSTKRKYFKINSKINTQNMSKKYSNSKIQKQQNNNQWIFKKKNKIIINFAEVLFDQLWQLNWPKCGQRFAFYTNAPVIRTANDRQQNAKKACNGPKACARLNQSECASLNPLQFQCWRFCLLAKMNVQQRILQRPEMHFLKPKNEKEKWKENQILYLALHSWNSKRKSFWQSEKNETKSEQTMKKRHDKRRKWMSDNDDETNEEATRK